MGKQHCVRTAWSTVGCDHAWCHLAYVVSLTQWGLRPLKLNIPFATAPGSSCTNQLTGIHLSPAGSSLSGHTSIYMVKHQICTRVKRTVVHHYIHSLCIPACTSLTREVFVIQSVRGGGQYSQSGYAFRKTSLSLETFILTPNTGSCDSKLYASIIMSHHAFQAWNKCGKLL